MGAEGAKGEHSIAAPAQPLVDCAKTGERGWAREHASTEGYGTPHRFGFGVLIQGNRLQPEGILSRRNHR